VIKSKKINVGISIGDPCGIGIEVLLKSISKINTFNDLNFTIYSSLSLIENQKKYFKINLKPFKKINTLDDISDDHINVKEVFNDDEFYFGKPNPKISKNGIISLKEATKDLKNNQIDILVTAPINKELAFSKSFKYKGHTDFFSDYFNTQPLMLMVSENLKVGLLTDHIPLKDVVLELKPEVIIKKINDLIYCLKQDFMINNPKIAMLSINPHVGDNGVIGSEDDLILKPILNDYKDNITGPYSADTFFINENYKRYDAILAVYHDQGLIPFKTISFGTGVNYTAGLPVIRTSPDHGTGFNIAGQGIANFNSFYNAIKIGTQTFKARNKIV